MAADRNPHAWLLAEYQAAVERERAEWKTLGDTRAGPVERLTAYGRWREAAERTKSLAITISDVRRGAVAPPEPTPHPEIQ